EGARPTGQGARQPGGSTLPEAVNAVVPVGVEHVRGEAVIERRQGLVRLRRDSSGRSELPEVANDVRSFSNGHRDGDLTRVLVGVERQVCDPDAHAAFSPMFSLSASPTITAWSNAC